MRFWGLLSGIKIRNKIFFLTIAGIAVFIIFASGAFILGKKEIQALERMYSDQIMPFHNLKEMQLEFREIESKMGGALSGVYDGTDGSDHLQKSIKDIDALWKKTASKLTAGVSSGDQENFTTGLKRFFDMVSAIEDGYRKIVHDQDAEPLKKAYSEWITVRNVLMQSIDRMADLQEQSLKQSYVTRIELIKKIRTGAVSGALVMTGWFIIFTLLIVRSINRPIKTVMEATQRVARGDFTCTVDLDSRDEMGRMASEMNAMITRLNETLKIITTEAESLFLHSEGLAGVSDLLVCGAEAERMQVNAVAVAAEQMSNAITEVGKNTLEAEKMTESSYETARSGSDIVEETKVIITELSDSVAGASEAIGNLGESSNRVGEIVSVIKDIADQTNLLALNAAIESARAGEQGRGFAVVADEVRKLAERTTQATGEVSGIIQAIQSETKSVITRLEKGKVITESAILKAEKAGESHTTIVKSCGNVLGMVQTIASATEEQSVTSRQVSDSMRNIIGVINQTLMLSENIKSVSAELTSVASQLKGQVENFKTSSADYASPDPLSVISTAPDVIKAH